MLLEFIDSCDFADAPDVIEPTLIQAPAVPEGLLGSFGPADRSRRGRRRCYCRQKDKIPHTTEYFPDARSDRRRSSASCLYPADCVCPPGSPVSTADLAPTLITAARSSDSDRKSFQATLVATAPRSGSCFPAIAAQKTS